MLQFQFIEKVMAIYYVCHKHTFPTGSNRALDGQNVCLPQGKEVEYVSINQPVQGFL